MRSRCVRSRRRNGRKRGPGAGDGSTARWLRRRRRRSPALYRVGRPRRPPILFLHGGSAHARWWDFVVQQLGDRFRCLALDLRGHGDSAWPVSLDYRLEAHAADVAAVIAALDLRRVALIGHSFGGFVAMACAPQRDSHLSGLVIVDSRARISDRSARFLDALRKLPHPSYASLDEAMRRFRLLPAAHAARPELSPTSSGTAWARSQTAPGRSSSTAAPCRALRRRTSLPPSPRCAVPCSPSAASTASRLPAAGWPSFPPPTRAPSLPRSPARTITSCSTTPRRWPM